MKVFVYGTLLKGEGNWQRLMNNDECHLLGEARVQGFTLHSLGPFPTVSLSNEPTDLVMGEVWEVSDLIFTLLDRLEGYPNFYNRMLTQTIHGEAWIYICNKLSEHAERIPSGSWRQYLETKRILSEKNKYFSDNEQGDKSNE